MKAPLRERPPGMRFNITPLIDVVFLLVIFFLVTAHFAQNEQVEAVELPRASEGADAAESARRMIVSVTRDGLLFVKGRQITAAEFEGLLQENAGGRTADYELRIRSDQLATYEQIEPLVFAALRVGVTKIGFAVMEK